MDTQINLDDIERKALAATPGPWNRQDFYSSGSRMGVDGPDGQVICASFGAGRHGDFDFIAAANPSVVLELVRRLRASEKTLQGMGCTYHGGELWKPPLGAAPQAEAEPVNASLLALLREAEKCISAAVRIEQHAHDEPPCPVSEWDYEAYRLAGEILAAIAAAESLKSEG